MRYAATFDALHSLIFAHKFILVLSLFIVDTSDGITLPINDAVVLCHRYILEHGLSRQGVWFPFWTPKPLKSTPMDTQIFLWGNY